MPFEMTVDFGGELRREIETNAAMCGITPDELLRVAPHLMTLIGHRQALLSGSITIKRGDETAGIQTDGNLDLFRGGVGLRIHEGIVSGDLGGAPLLGLRAKISVSDRVLSLAAEVFGTEGPTETCGFLVWSLLRLMNTLREEFPGGTIGVASLRDREFIPVYGPSANNPKSWGIYLAPPEPVRETADRSPSLP